MLRGYLPARELQAYKLPFDIQALTSDINLRKESGCLLTYINHHHRAVNSS